MSTKVAPNKVDELSAEFNRLSRLIENEEMGINKEILRLIQNTNSQYSESYVRSTTSEAQGLLRQIRRLASSVTEELNNKSSVLKKAADRYRKDEEDAKRTVKTSKGFSLSNSIFSTLGGFFKTVGKVVSTVTGKVLGFLFGKGKNKYHEPTIDLPLDISPLESNIKINTNKKSEEVKKMQQRLKDLGYDIKVDGYFGDQTLAIVNLFKDKYSKKWRYIGSYCQKI